MFEKLQPETKELIKKYCEQALRNYDRTEGDLQKFVAISSLEFMDQMEQAYTEVTDYDELDKVLQTLLTKVLGVRK